MKGWGARRVLLPLLAAAAVLMTVWVVVAPSLEEPAGDYQVRQGDILLTDGKWEAAIERFDAALQVSPEHRGAMMGKAIAYLQSGRLAEAEAAFNRLIARLERTLTADDATGRGVLAGAYANRGILNDRQERYEAALADYRHALAIDASAVEGPKLFDKILYGNARPSSVGKRAAYLQQQLSLPEADRRLRVPELDAEERMHKP